MKNKNNDGLEPILRTGKARRLGGTQQKNNDGLTPILHTTKKKERDYEAIANVLYPTMTDKKEVEKLKEKGKKELSEIEKERWLEHGKNFGGAALEIGSAFVPGLGGAKVAKARRLGGTQQKNNDGLTPSYRLYPLYDNSSMYTGYYVITSECEVIQKNS